MTQYYYHVYNRGVSGERIFLNDANYQFLLRKIKQYLPNYSIAFIAYCLMPTHYHFLIRDNSSNRISAFIQRLFNSYTQAFNRQHQRQGKLFDKKPANKLVDSDEYVLELSRYIHLNPVRANLVVQPKDWKYSSYLDWIETSSAGLFDIEFVKAYFPNPKDYEEFVLSEIETGGKTNLPKV